MLFILLACAGGDNIKADPSLLDTGDDIVDAVDLDGDGADSSVDCDDQDATSYPDAPEVCDGIDNNCDGQVDEGLVEVIYEDLDGDGYGDSSTGEKGCPSTSTASIGGDCDDSNGAINPGAQEVCDDADTDEDCDGLADDLDDSTDPATQETGYIDADGDGYGADGAASYACSLSSDYIPFDGDCDDDDAAINPDALEICDEDYVDEDCNGFANDEDSNLAEADMWYPDADGDGYGDVQGEVAACSQPSGYIADGEDCDDTDSSENPTDGCDWNGTYVGTFEIEATFAKAVTDTCTGTAEIEVDDSATRQLIGEVECSWAGSLGTFYGDITGDVLGDFTAVSDAEAAFELSTGARDRVPLSFVAPDYLEGELTATGHLIVYTISVDLAR